MGSNIWRGVEAEAGCGYCLALVLHSIVPYNSTAHAADHGLCHICDELAKV